MKRGSSKKKQKIFDWKTCTLIVLACAIIVTLTFNIFNLESSSTLKYRYIKNWQKLTNDSQAPIQLIKFYTYSCGYCDILYKRLDRLKEKYSSEIAFTYIPIYFNSFDIDYH